MHTKSTAVKSLHPGEVLVQDGDIDILRRGKTGAGYKEINEQVSKQDDFRYIFKEENKSSKKQGPERGVCCLRLGI